MTTTSEEGDTAADKLKGYIRATFAEDANTRNVSAALLAETPNATTNRE